MKIEIRSDSVAIEGYVNAVARDSRELPSARGRFVEQILPTVWEKAIDKAEDIKLLFNHKENRELGSIKQGNLELFEDNIGLRAICTIYDDEVIQKAKDKKLTGWSFGFIPRKDFWEDFKDGVQRRFIQELELLEVSILDKTPAYIGTSIETRGEETLIREIRNETVKAVISDLAPEERVEPQKVDYTLEELELYILKGGKQ